MGSSAQAWTLNLKETKNRTVTASPGVALGTPTQPSNPEPNQSQSYNSDGHHNHSWHFLRSDYFVPHAMLEMGGGLSWVSP